MSIRKKKHTHRLVHRLIMDVNGNIKHPDNDDEFYDYMTADNCPRFINRTDIDKDVALSTVFCTSPNKDGKPYFETMVLGGKMSGERWHTSTLQDAKDKHDEILQQLYSMSRSDIIK